MTDLPPGWASTTLGDIALSVKNGIYISRPGREPNGVPILRISAVRELRLDLSDIRYSGRTQEDLAQHDALVVEGDILFTRYNGNADYVGVGALVPPGTPPLTYPDKLIRVRVDPKFVDPRYVAYAFAAPAVRAKVQKVCRTTAGQVGISGSSLRGVNFPLPPLAEQRRVVAELEDHLSHLDSSADFFRSALQKANGIRMRFLADCVADTEKVWDQYLLGQVVESLRNGMYVSRPGLEPVGVPILRIGSVRALHLDTTDVRYSGRSVDEVDRDDYLLQEGDLLFTRYNGNPEYVGACATVPHGVESLTYPDKLIRVRVKNSYVFPEYLAVVCSAGESREAIRRSIKTTAGQAGISGRDLKSVPIRLPNLEEQMRRVREFAGSEHSLQRLEYAVKSASMRASALRRSLLCEAFSGRLGRHESADVPSSIHWNTSGQG
jgi:type I restriction enzyme, S subunit